ncbi:MAG: glycosyltransferase family 39 protein, partial [Anaerolineaceae bacterium]|nr:glycosyltransferase family 39 protein [Anaerolineaceae bacterium]
MKITSRASFLREWGWSGLFWLAAGEALAALIILVSLPADAENSVFLGLSARRLVLVGLLFLLGSGCAGLGWLSRKTAWRMRWLDPSLRRGLFNTLLVALPLGAAASLLAPLVLMSLYRTGGDFRYFAYYERLLPLIAWVGLFCLQGTLWVAWVGDFQWGALRCIRRSLVSGLVVFGLFALAWVFVGVTKIGITADVVGWGDPAVPLLEWQIWLSWLVGIVFLVFLLERQWPARRDWIMAGAIWLLAAGLWLSQPVQTAFFATAGRAPNYEIYPFSDGAYYGQYAQNLLIGNGYEGNQVPPRPMYILLLAVFHALAGQKYENVIVLQTLVMALLPVVLYFIGKELHSRPAGLAIALMAILREFTAILTVAITNKASTTQLFFADVPSALANSLWALMTLMWIKAPGKNPLLALLVGGSLGMAMLFRTQSLFMLPFVLLLALLVLRGRWTIWFGQLGLILLGLGLILAPWLWRNWQVTGQLAFDDPKTQTGVMAQRYSLSDNTGPEFAMQSGEDIQTYSTRVNQGLIQFMLERPAVVVGFVSAHFLNAEIDNLLLLPVRDGIDTPKELLMPTRPFWETWSGSPAVPQVLLIALNLGLIALGVGSAWAYQRWAGLALISMNLMYNGSNALARNSGWRYLLPIDWVVIVYAGIGLVELTIAFFLILGVSPASLAKQMLLFSNPYNPPARPNRRSGWAWIGVSLALLLIGSMLPLAEVVVPDRYPHQTEKELAAEILSNPLASQMGVDEDHLEMLLSQPKIRLLKGRALYPRFYAAGDGEPRTAKMGYEPLGYPRTLFLFASGPYNGLVMFRADQVPGDFPNAADVIVLGCM